MTFLRLPLFVWTTLVTNVLILLAFPPITVALIFLMFDRFFGTPFYIPGRRRLAAPLAAPVLDLRPPRGLHPHPARDGDRLRGAAGIRAEALFGYPSMVYATALIGFLGFGVWAHHMFAVGMGPIADSAFALTSMLIAIPTGIKIFNWLSTSGAARSGFATPFCFAAAFVGDVHDRRPVRHHARLAAGRSPADRLLLRGGALPLRALRRHGPRAVRGDLLLVPEDDRAPARRAARRRSTSG